MLQLRDLQKTFFPGTPLVFNSLQNVFSRSATASFFSVAILRRVSL